MSRIRPFERADLQRVVELYERTMRSGRPAPPPGLAPYFERTLLDHPWADADIPSLVYEADGGRVLGFIGSHVRRLLFDGRPIRMGCAGLLVSDPAHRSAAIGALLLRRYLSGPQDLTITDGGTDVVAEMWLRLGGHAAQPGSIVWTRPLRPWRAVGDRWLERGGHPAWRRLARPAWSLLDASVRRITRPAPDVAGIEAAELTADALVEHQGDVFGDVRLRVDYDEPFVEWLFRELDSVRTRGRLERRMLRRDGRVLGWYIAYMKPGGKSEVLEVAAANGAFGDVLDRLFLDAWRGGVAALEGRMEQVLYDAISRRRCLLRYGDRALFHSRDPELAAAIALHRSALTRLDGEWWMGHHIEPFS